MECKICKKKRKEWKTNTNLCEFCAADEGRRIYEQQLGKCAICEDQLGPAILKPSDQVPRAANLDHNHYTGKIRGVLCRSCNLGLGHFKDKNFKDSSDRLRKAALYIERWDK